MSPVSAYDGMFAVLDQRYFDGNWSNISSNGTSTVEPINTGRMIGWVDIIGFENTTVLNGTEYVNGTPVPVFNYDVSPGSMRFNDNVDLLTSTVEINQTDTDVVVTVTAKLDWHHSTMRTGTSALGQTFHWIDKDYFTDTGIFVDSVPLPAIYTMPDPGIIEIVQYNNTVNPHSIVMFPTLENVYRVIVRYNDSEIVRHLMYGVIENKTSGAEYVNLTGIEHWEIT
ncbi:MAG: hypothetical protein JXA38_06700, partial [Methanosarcinaceae archaeon]|nr:hypothetical protein [Methanosarcinaceae archaeon]